MAVDTPRKRRSSIPGSLPLPDGDIDSGDQRTVSDVYDSSTSSTPPVGGVDTARGRRSATPGVLPKPDGSIDAGDRRTVSGVYDRTPDDGVADTGTDLLVLSVVRIRVDVKITKDRGSGTTSASVPVTVPFNKTFADIISLDAFPVSNAGQKIFRVIDFVDAPDPTSFDLRFFDETGTQLALDFGWVAEGILKSS